MPESDWVHKVPHVGVKGDFVGKLVPPDGRAQAGSDKPRGGNRTGTRNRNILVNMFRRASEDIFVNNPKVI